MMKMKDITDAIDDDDDNDDDDYDDDDGTWFSDDGECWIYAKTSIEKDSWCEVWQPWPIVIAQ